ncbi:MAG: sucrose phosphorylase [Burkholderiales bacterium]|nr:sucrose phosphorylase [Burkholderiales bacterium]
MKNQVQLITYVDRLGGGGIDDLRRLLAGPLDGLFGGVHLLPFFNPIDGADAGFDPIDHTQVDPRLGDWAAVKRLASETEVMADVIVNHVSTGSPQFRDFSERGSASPWSGLFLTYDAVFPKGASAADLLTLYRPRPGLPFTVSTLANGERRILWTTFTPQQADIDVEHPSGRAYLSGILHRLSENGIRMVRLDAVGYAIKKPGSSCFMLPQTLDFIAAFAAEAEALGMEVLVEIHSHYRRQIEIARRVDWVYDFALPPLVLHAFRFETARPLKAWIGERPDNALTVLDTHDGIGIIDIGADAADREGLPGLVPAQELDALVEHIHAASGGQSRRATGAAASNLDLYQVNCTFYDALGRDDNKLLMARAVQFFMPGIPQVYYVGLLAGENDMDLLARTGVGRDINRHYYSREEIDAALARPVVRSLIELIRLRNTHVAFGGVFTLLPTGDQMLAMQWRHGEATLVLEADFARAEFRIIEGRAPNARVLPF